MFQRQRLRLVAWKGVDGMPVTSTPHMQMPIPEKPGQDIKGSISCFIDLFESFACTYICVLHECLGPWRSEEVLEPLELELQL